MGVKRWVDSARSRAGCPGLREGRRVIGGQTRRRNHKRNHPARARTGSPSTSASSLPSATGDPPLVSELRARHAKLATTGMARPFELLLPDRSSHRIGEGGGEPAFLVRIVWRLS